MSETEDKIYLGQKQKKKKNENSFVIEAPMCSNSAYTSSNTNGLYFN